MTFDIASSAAVTAVMGDGTTLKHAVAGGEERTEQEKSMPLGVMTGVSKSQGSTRWYAVVHVVFK